MNHTRDALNAQLAGWAGVQQRANELARDKGRPLSTGEVLSLTTCNRCGDVNDCTCGE